MFRRIPCDWFLSDGVLPAVRLETPETVLSALRHAGVIPARSCVMDGLKDEWAYRRVWRYRASFALEASPRRRFLSVTGLSGKWEVSLNGGTPITGDASALDAEVTSLLQSGENRIEISFPAPDCALIAPVVGFCGAFSLRETDSAVFNALRLEASPEGGCVWLAEIDAEASCDAVLQAQIKTHDASLDAKTEITLQGGVQSAAFTPFTADNYPRGERATLTLRLLVGGEISDETTLSVYFPEAALAPRGFVGADEFVISACARAGGTAVYATGSSVLAADCRLIALNDAPQAQTALTAMTREDMLTPLLDGDLTALNESAVWLLTESDREGLDRTRALFGCETADWSKISALSRYHQAADLRRRAEDARLKGEAFLLDKVMGAQASCASPALFDFDALPRPACFALKDAWKEQHAYVRAPQSFPEDGIINIPIYYAFDANDPGVVINAIALRLDGQELVSATFPAAGRADGLVGRLCTELPEDGCVLLRTKVMKNGVALSVSDDVISPRPETLSALPETQLIWDESALKNVGSCAAVGVSVPGAEFFGTLLPGESVTLSDPGVKFAEGLNIYF